MIDVEAILKRYSNATKYRDIHAPVWREISDYVRPIKDEIAIDPGNVHTPNTTRLAELFDTTAIDANRTYAAGCMSWMTPSETTWFAFDAPEAFSDSDEVKKWYSQCTDISRTLLAGSNFYSNIHETYLDDGAFGTSGLIVDEDSRDGVSFETLQIGAYCILENEKQEVDTVFRDLKLTPRQAAAKFGEKNLSEKVQKMLNENSKDCDNQGKYLHAVYPRTERDITKQDPNNMPWASVYIDVTAKKIVKESGQWEMPIAVHRHLHWSSTPYGFSPGMQALADCRQLNYMQQCMDALVEKQVSPPTLVPSNFEGRVDLRAGGYTYFKSEAEIPRFWQNPGQYMIGEDRTVFRANQINRAFHVELFQALASVPIGKEMTAAEIHMRQRDRLTLFSPTFARKNNELNNPIMRRVFAILLRAGAFPMPPRALVQDRGDGMPFIPDPKIVYTSRLALQIKAIHNESFLRVMDTVGPLAQVQPDMLDHLDTDKLFRGIARNEGFKEEWLRSERDVADIRKARAQAQAQAMQEESAHREAESVSKLSKAGMVA